MAPVLEVHDLSVEIESRGISFLPVNRVSFSVERGEFFGIVGESGCGKTTLLRAICNSLNRGSRKVGGRILIGDGLARGSEEPARPRIGIVMQDPLSALNPVLKVGDQIAEAPRWLLGLSRAGAKKRALALMEQVGIPDPGRRYNAFPHELSGGLNQRVLIAISLSAQPTILLCDEPTTALDVTVQDQILRLLVDISGQMGLSVVYVTHDIAVVAQTCNRMAVMYAGQLIEVGPVEALFWEPRHPYLAALLASAPDLDLTVDRLRSIPGAPPDLRDIPSGCPFHPRCQFATAECEVGEFPLRPISGDHSTACIHHEALASMREPVA